MRILPLLGLAALIAGCATVPQQDNQASSASSMTSAKEESVAYGPCAASRATILASVSAARAAAIARGFAWLDADVRFSETDTYGTYRTDCSGFVSMCWSLPAPGLNTRTLGTSGSGSYRLDSYDELVPADALVNVGHHSVVFLGWNDTAHKGACVLEQSSSKNNMQFRVRLKSELQGDGFVPVRSDEFTNDTAVNTPSHTAPSAGTAAGTGTTADDHAGTDTATGTANDIPPSPPSPSSPSSPPADDTYGTGDTSETDATYESPVCKSTSVLVVCAAAYANGVECGRVIDNCGRAVDCTGMPGFGCGAGETCSSNKCTSTCHPKSKEDLCYSAQLKSGIECGTIADGCGGTVDCSDLPYFTCGGGSCGADNKCARQPGSGGTDHDKCEGSQDNPEVCPPTASTRPAAKGDPGDDEGGTVHPSSTRTASDDHEPAAKSSGVASSGCSSAPGGSSSGFGAVALAFFVMLGARRRRTGSR